MKTRYSALLTPKMVAVVSYVLTTSGEAARIEVEEIGARKEQKDRMATIKSFREGENLE